MSQTPNTATAAIGIDIGKNPFHVVGSRWATGPPIDREPPSLIGHESAICS
jgi:hypothetical protein